MIGAGSIHTRPEHIMTPEKKKKNRRREDYYEYLSNSLEVNSPCFGYSNLAGETPRAHSNAAKYCPESPSLPFNELLMLLVSFKVYIWFYGF